MKAPIDIVCPACKAAPGGSCISPTSTPGTYMSVTFHHAERVDAVFREASGEEEAVHLKAENKWLRDRFDAHHPARGSRPDDLTVAEEKLDDLGAEIEKLKLDLSDPYTREVWESARQAKKEVASWPAWKRGEPPARGAERGASVTPEEAVALAREVINKYGADTDKPSVHLAKALLAGAHERDRFRAALMEIAVTTGTPEQRSEICQSIARKIVDWMPY